MFKGWCDVSGNTLETFDTWKNTAIAWHGFFDDNEWQAIQDFVGNYNDVHETHGMYFLHSVGLRVHNRRLLKTKGDIIGMESYFLQAGDQIWFTRDSRTPLILRPKPETKDFGLLGRHTFMVSYMARS